MCVAMCMYVYVCLHMEEAVYTHVSTSVWKTEVAISVFLN